MRPKIVKNYYPKMFGSIWDRKLFTWKELETLINIRPLMHERRVNLLGCTVEYNWMNSPWSKHPDCYPPTLLRELIEKYVVYIGDMSRCTKKINDFARKLERKYRLPCDAHLYMCRNPTGGHPFGIHFDRSHNVIIQCDGETNFKVWEKIKDRDLFKMTHYQNQSSVGLSMNDPPLMDVIMKPGDAIWIPAYYPHLALSKTCRLSVSFPLLLSTEWGREYEDRKWVEL